MVEGHDWPHRVAKRPVGLLPVTEERDMWITLFSLALGAAVCFGVTAVILAHSKSIARLSG